MSNNGDDPVDLGVDGFDDPQFVGRGGAAVVYRAWQASLQRVVAIKLVTGAWDESVARRFDREQRAMGRLSNKPGIVPVYASGVNRHGVPYIVMPYYEQGSLKDLSEREGPMPWQRAADLTEEIARAVGRAHSEGIVHRDIKPANVLLTGSGRPLVADFGIAKLTTDVAGPESTTVAFTPAFCPPEVMDGADPEPRADTYALAATLWALVVGRPPFTDPGMALGADAILKRVLLDPPPVLENVPPELAAFVSEAMSKQPEDRPENGEVFADRLSEIVTAATRPAQHTLRLDALPPSPDHPPTNTATPSPAPVGSSLRTWQVVAASAVSIALAGGIGFAILQQRTSPSALTTTTLAPEPAIISADGSNPLRILPLATDEESGQALDEQRAALFAIRDFGTIRDVEIEVLPTLQLSCGRGLDAAEQEQLTTTDAALLFGSPCARLMPAVMEFANRSDVSWISPALSSATLTVNVDGTAASDHVDGFFRSAPNDQFQGPIAAQFAADDLGAKKAVVIHGALSGAAEIAGAFADAFVATGEVATVNVDGGTDAAVQAVREAQPDVIFLVLDSDEALEFLTAANSATLGEIPRIAVSEALSLSSAGNELLAGTLVVVPQRPSEEAETTVGTDLSGLLSRYRDEFGGTPTDQLSFALAYDATLLGLSSLEAASTAQAGGLIIDRTDLRTALEIAEIEGLTGTLKCNFLGDCGAQAWAIVEADGISVESTLDQIVKLFARS